MFQVSRARLEGEIGIDIPQCHGAPVKGSINIDHRGHILLEFDDQEFVKAIWKYAIDGRLTHLELAYGRIPTQETELCHCGRSVFYGYDGNPNHHRGMCEDCDAARCDVDPTNCPYREKGEEWTTSNI
jgi:hypothetical protein